MRSNYQDWLRAQGYAARTVAGQLSQASRVEDHYGDLDQHYDHDRCVHLLSQLTYSTGDSRHGRPNPSKLVIDGDIRNGLAAYKSSVVLYARFRAELLQGGAPLLPLILDAALTAPAPEATTRLATHIKTVKRSAAPKFEPWSGARTFADFNLDGRAAFEALLAASQYKTVAQAVASLSLFSHPKTVEQTGRKAIFHSIRNPRRVGQIDVHEGRRVLLDDNKTPTEAFLWANGLSRRGPDTQFNHIYATSLDVDAYTALPNICMTPAFVAKLTDTSSAVRALLRFRSYQLYGWTPKSVEPPVRPDEYESLEWAAPLPAVPDVRVAIEAAMATKPKNRTVLAARELGWLFGPPESATAAQSDC